MADKVEKPQEGQRQTFKQKIATYRGEFAKITWPTKEELTKQSITVIIACALIASIIFGMDFVLNWLLNFFIGIMPR
jgi:preprotein translocase SecE subunit